jgi:hypothetical protein
MFEECLRKNTPDQDACMLRYENGRQVGIVGRDKADSSPTGAKPQKLGQGTQGAS